MKKFWEWRKEKHGLTETRDVVVEHTSNKGTIDEEVKKIIVSDVPYTKSELIGYMIEYCYKHQISMLEIDEHTNIKDLYNYLKQKIEELK
jgi:hypothetical protein